MLLQHWLLRFGATSAELRLIVGDFVEWLGNGRTPWAAYQALISVRLIALDKQTGIRTIGVGETWMAPSIPASRPPASCVVPQAALASVPATFNRHFAIMRHNVSPTPIGLIPDCLSSAISRTLMSAR